MTNSDNRYFWITIKFYISFLLIFVIVSFVSDVIIGAIIGFIGALSVSIIILLLERKLKKSDKKKEAREVYKEYLLIKLKEHKTDLIDKILKELEDTKIRCDEFDLWKGGVFKVWIEGLEELEVKKIYKQAIQHLKEYSDIYGLLVASIKKINGDKINDVDGLNDELKGLSKYLSEKISDKFEVERNKLHSSIWCIMEGIKQSEKIEDSESLDKFLDGITIIIKSKTVYVDSSDGRNLAQMSCKKVNVNDVKDFLSDLIKKGRDNEFREKIKSFTMGYKELKETFDDFKNKLNGLLQDVEGEEDKLKGECNKCLTWVKEIG